jgi:hypothetical protein
MKMAMDGPDDAHQRPEGLDDDTVEALGKLSEALETIDRARGHLYTMHQLTGTADFLLDDVVAGLRRAGREAAADLVDTELLGRNVLPGRWTFQVVEEYDDGYYAAFQRIERRLRDELAGGRRHLWEAELKEKRRTRGHPGHEAQPGPDTY